MFKSTKMPKGLQGGGFQIKTMSPGKPMHATSKAHSVVHKTMPVQAKAGMGKKGC